MKFTQKKKVSASMVGSNESLSVIGAFGIVEDAITEYFGQMGIDGITVKQKYGAFWVFVKNRIRFFKKIFWNDEYTVTAFISFMSFAKLHADVRVCDEVGDEVFYARVELCVLDIAKQRIKKIADVGVEPSMLSDEPTADIEFGAFDTTDLPLVEQVKVRSTNIDHSHHTNNLEYLRFIMNTYSVAELETQPIKEMEVVYASQSHEGDLLDVHKASHADRDWFVLQKDGKPVVKCEIVF